MSRTSEQGSRPRRGRGAASNPTGRYEAQQVEAFDDGWGSLDEPAPPLDTRISIDAAKSVLTRNDSPDLDFDLSVNPYRGCEHGCVYCYARPTHAYLGLSPGIDFESKLYAKPNAPELLERELRRPSYRCRLIALGTNTDPYQPAEREMRITRRILEVLDRFRNPVGIVTKSSLVVRDADLLARMARERRASVTLSVTTLNRALARRMEPRAATPERRLETIRRLGAAGVPVGVLVAPIIPGITDSELEGILSACREAGALAASYILLRLPLELKELFEEWLRLHYPDRAARVLNRVREMRGGALYEAEFGTRQRGRGPFAQLLASRFASAKARLGFPGMPDLDSSRFRVPPAPGQTLPLFDAGN